MPCVFNSSVIPLCIFLSLINSLRACLASLKLCTTLEFSVAVLVSVNPLGSKGFIPVGLGAPSTLVLYPGDFIVSKDLPAASSFPPGK